MMVFVITYKAKYAYEGDEVISGVFGVASTPENAQQMMEECRDYFRNSDPLVEMTSTILDD